MQYNIVTLQNDIEREFVASYLLTQLNTRAIPQWLYYFALTWYELDDISLVVEEIHLEACWNKPAI